MTIKKRALALPVLGLLTLALSSPARADILTLSLANPVEDASPGSMVSFIATVSAPNTNTADIFLNSDSTTVDFPLTLDDSPFFNGFPLSLSPGGSFTGALFTITVPSFATPDSTYNGYFEIDGGADANAGNDLASVTFQVVTTAPEPEGLILPFTMLLGLAIVSWRKYCLR